MIPVKDLPEQWRARLAMSWQMRALLLLEETERRTDGADRMFRVLLAALEKEPPNLPIFGPKAFVDARGRLHVHQFRKGWFPLMPKLELVARVQGIVDALDLSQAEAQELCRTIEAWIKTDLSPGQMTVEDRVPGVDKPRKTD